MSDLKKPIYFDYMASTPTDARVAHAMTACMEMAGSFGNPSSTQHFYGWEAAEQVEQARVHVAQLIHADPREIIWTSGATESDNLALKGAALFYQRQGKHIITLATEHKAVLDTCAWLSTQGFTVTYLKPEKNGVLDLEKLQAAIRPDTILVSIMHVNNETGVIQDIQKISHLLKERGIIFHVDAAQSAGKIPIDLRNMRVDLMSFSAHKIYGPKGVGVLFVRQQPRVHLVPQMHGGGQQLGLRSGTLATQQIVGMGTAFALAQQEMVVEAARILQLRERLWQGLQLLSGVHLNGDATQRIPGCLNIYVDGIEGESLLVSLSQLALSSGSACNSANPEPSHVLLAMGIAHENAQRSLRMSLGRFTTPADVDHAIEQFRTQVNRLRKLSPLWKKG